MEEMVLQWFDLPGLYFIVHQTAMSVFGCDDAGDYAFGIGQFDRYRHGNGSAAISKNQKDRWHACDCIFVGICVL